MSNKAFVNNDRALEVLSDLIGEHEQTIFEKWLTCLRLDQKYRINLETYEAKGQQNIIDFAVNLLEKGCSFSDKEIESFLKKIRQTDYSITDLFSEVTCLQNAIEETVISDGLSENIRLDVFKGMGILRRSLSYLCKTMLENTSLFYELALESGISGFCQIDPEGIIIYGNSKLTNLAEVDTLEGMLFEDLFSGSHKSLVRSALSPDKGKMFLLQQSQLTSSNENIVPVGLELASLFVGDWRLGSYARVTDLTEPLKMQNQIYDKFLLGIVRLDRERRITYLNQSFCDLLGMDSKDFLGMNFNKLIPDKENLEILERQLENRFQGESDEYNIKLCQPAQFKDDNRTIPVRISASPEMDLQGEVIGTMGIIRSIVRDNMYLHMQKQSDAENLLELISKELKSEVPFDNLYIYLFSSDMKHVRNFFSYETDQKMQFEKRWWEMTPAMIEWAKEETILAVQDIEAFYKDPMFRHLKNDPSIIHLINNYKSFINYPILRDNKTVAGLVLYSKSKKPYGPSHRRLLSKLPLDTAVLTALHYDEKKHLEFVINLLKKISTLGDDPNKIACMITKEIAVHYKWENVSIFKVDKAEEKFVLLHQEPLSEDFRIGTDHMQSIQKGVLGLVYETKETVYVKDVNDPKWKDIYIATVPSTKSELCLPIQFQSGDLFWLLNIEDQLANAFSIEEIRSLESLIKEISVFLERAWLSKFLEKSMQETSDAVITLNFNGDITFINRAATDMLEYEEDELLEKPLATILMDKEMENFIINAPKIPNTSVTFLTRRGTEVKLLLSKIRLHEEFRTNIIIAKNLEIQNRLEELNYLKKLYSEIAFQTKTPLTLVFSWLNRIKKRFSKSETPETFNKIIRQLRKLELTFDRLALYDKDKIAEPDFPYNEMLISITEIKQRIYNDFPQEELRRVIFDCENENLSFLSDMFQITFCFETILSYLLRSIPSDDKILVKIFIEKGRIAVKIEGDVPQIAQDEDQSETRYATEKALVDIALGETIIKQFIKNSKGVYQKPRTHGQKIEFQFNFPLAEEYDHG